MAAASIVRHAAFTTLAMLILAVINGSKLAHAIMHVHRNAAGNTQVKKG